MFHNLSPKPDVLPLESLTEIAGDCRENVGTLVRDALKINMAETGQRHTRDVAVRARQGLKFLEGVGELDDDLQEVRGYATDAYRRLGSSMCEGCFGRDACILRAVDEVGERIISDGGKLRVYAGLLPTSARANIKAGKPTPSTVTHSRNTIARTRDADN